jgi:hypothetical protein
MGRKKGAAPTTGLSPKLPALDPVKQKELEKECELYITKVRILFSISNFYLVRKRFKRSSTTRSKRRYRNVHQNTKIKGC